MEKGFKRRPLRINTLNKDTKGMWEEAKILAPLPPRRCNHSASLLLNKLIIYGGQDISEGVLSDMWVLNISPRNTIEESWTKIELNADSPGPLCRHSSVVYDEKLFILGGIDLIQDKSSFFSYCINRNTWEKLTSPFASIDSHTAVTHNNTMVVFGGYTEGCLSNALFMYNFDSRTWSNLESISAPSPRAEHSAVVLGDCVYIYGGLLQNSEYSADLYQYDLNKHTWNYLEANGESPGSVSNHTANLYNSVMLVFGGNRDILKETNEMYAFDFESSSWLLIQSETESVDPVFSHEDTKPTEKRNTLFPYASHRMKSNDKTKAMTRVPDGYAVKKPKKPVVFQGRIRGKIPNSRDGHTSVVFEDYLIIFGGDRHKMPFNDLYFYSINENLLKKTA